MIPHPRSVVNLVFPLFSCLRRRHERVDGIAYSHARLFFFCLPSYYLVSLLLLHFNFLLLFSVSISLSPLPLSLSFLSLSLAVLLFRPPCQSPSSSYSLSTCCCFLSRLQHSSSLSFSYDRFCLLCSHLLPIRSYSRLTTRPPDPDGSRNPSP